MLPSPLTQPMKRSLLAAVAVVFLCPFQVLAAISVGPSGIGPFSFDTTPPEEEFSTGILLGVDNTYLTVGDLHAAVASKRAGDFTRRLPTTTSMPPQRFSGGFRHNLSGRFLQSSPTTSGTNGACVLVARLMNESGTSRPALVIGYDYFAYAADPWAELPGFYAYYSFSGEPGTWTFIPELSGSETPGWKQTLLPLGNWPDQSPLYLLWVDDNNITAGEPGSTMDHFVATFCTNAPVIIEQPQPPPLVVQAQSIVLSLQAGDGCVNAAARGSYQWFKAGVGPIDPGANLSAATSTLVIPNAQLSDEGNYYAKVSNIFGEATTETVHVAVIPDLVPPRLISASILPSSQSFRVVVDEPLCLSEIQCGGDARLPSNWEVRDAVTFESLEIFQVDVSGTNIDLKTLVLGQPGRRYEVRVTGAGQVTDRFGNVMALEPSVITFPMQSFVATADAEIHEGALANIPLGSATSISVGSNGGTAQGLVRFDGIVGNGPGQVPYGAEIISAALTLNQIDPGGFTFLRRMLVPWDESTATWNSLSNGISANGIEATTGFDATIASPAANGLVTLSVQAAVQAWVNGQPNYGWALMVGSSDNFAWQSRESATPPTLLVSYLSRGDGCELTFVAQPPPAITVDEGSSFSISATLSNSVRASFQWMQDGEDIPGADSPTWSVVGARANCNGFGDEGIYRLRVSCDGLSVTSAPCMVRVIPDVFSPRLTAVRVLNETNVLLEFSQTLDRSSAEDVQNYQFTPFLQVLGARLSNNTVRVQTQPRPFVPVKLRVSGILDHRNCTNSMLPTEVDLTVMRVEVPWASPWLYTDMNLDATLSATPWFNPEFDTSNGWMLGSGLFGFENSAAVLSQLPQSISTPLAPRKTSYFRKWIELQPLPPGARYVLCHVVDDGAVFYLDRHEIGRFNITNLPPVRYSHTGATNVEAQCQCFHFDTVAGWHVLAVEVHDYDTSVDAFDQDIVFGAQILTVGAGPELRIRNDEHGPELQWNADSSWELLTGTNLIGIAKPVNTSWGRYAVPGTNLPPKSFYRLRYNGRH